VLIRAELEALADAVELRQLRLLEVGALAREVRAGVHHRRVEEAGEEVVAEVVVGADVLARAAAGVLGDEAAEPVQDAARLGDAGAEGAGLVGEAAGADPDQGDQVVGLPEPVDVALAEADRAVQGAAPGGRVVDPDARVEAGRGLAVGAAAPVLDHLDLAAAGAREDRADRGARDRVLHRATSAPSGCG
jgi:hypothetical protein